MRRQTSDDHEKEDGWRRHCEQWGRSGLSQPVYCQKHSLALSTFQLWRRRLKGTAPTACLDIVPVPQPGPTNWDPQPPVVLVLDSGRYRIEVGNSAVAGTVRLVLDVLEGRR